MMRGSVTVISAEKDPEKPTDEAQLFREAVRGVKPLGASVPAVGTPKKVRARARFTRADRAAVLRESLEAAAADPGSAAGDELVFHQPHIHVRIVRRLRRGEYRVQREIDLHGMSVPQAKQALRHFLIEALEEQVRCVRIVHGKGLRSGHRGPVLKGVVSALLRNTGAVLAYVSARPVDGGTGALYVLLEGR
jgi:DNA-nicking Smr family endonuclease